MALLLSKKRKTKKPQNGNSSAVCQDTLNEAIALNFVCGDIAVVITSVKFLSQSVH